METGTGCVGGLDALHLAPVHTRVACVACGASGAEASASTARRLELNRKLDNIMTQFAGAVMDWDAESARIWGRLKHSPEVKRQPQALWDSLIDAMAVRLDATVATRNEKDFRHAKTFNPWAAT